MKKALLFTFIFAVAMGLMFSQSITVTSPSGGTWYKGTSHNITWTSTGCSSPNVKINIYKDSVIVANFVEQLTGTNSGTKSWTVPMGYATGNYIIRIKTDPAEDGCLGDSSVFRIANEPTGESGTISVTSPTTSTKWLRGSTQTITWNKTGDLDSNVKINIYKDSIVPANFVVQLTGPNSGSKSWEIPGTTDAGTYFLRVKESTGDVYGDSAAFEITQFLTFQPVIVATMFKPHSIEITEPSGRDLALNSRMRILWRPKNLVNNVKISLMKNGELFGVIEENLAPGRISTEWNVGTTLIKTAIPDSGFKIRIEEMGTTIFKESNTFSIVGEKKIDLSCYVLGHSSRDSGRVVRLNVKVRINNFGGPPIAMVPVQVNVRTQGDTPGTGENQTKYLENVTYRGHSYEYSLSFDFRLHSGGSGMALRRLDRIATVIVDPEDTLRDRRRMNNTSTYTFNF